MAELVQELTLRMPVLKEEQRRYAALVLADGGQRYPLSGEAYGLAPEVAAEFRAREVTFAPAPAADYAVATITYRR